MAQATTIQTKRFCIQRGLRVRASSTNTIANKTPRLANIMKRVTHLVTIIFNVLHFNGRLTRLVIRVNVNNRNKTRVSASKHYVSRLRLYSFLNLRTFRVH